MRKVCSKNTTVAFEAAHSHFATTTPLTGIPPAELVDAITTWPFEAEEALLNVVMAWSRREMSRAVLTCLLSVDQQFRGTCPLAG
jgi:hypothetical protein